MRKSLPKRHYYPDIWGPKKAFKKVSGVSLKNKKLTSSVEKRRLFSIFFPLPR